MAERAKQLNRTAHATWVLTDIIDSKQTMLSLNGLMLQDLPPLFYDEMLEGNLPPLEVLSLKGNQLSYIPPEIATITTLKMLYFDDNRIKVIPAQLPPAIVCLFLKGNKIEKIPPVLCEMHTLQLLDLRNNNILSVPSAVAKMRSLNVIKLNDNPGLRALPLELIKKKTVKIEMDLPIIFPIKELKLCSEKHPPNVYAVLEYVEAANAREWPLDIRCHWETDKPACHFCQSPFSDSLPARNCRICGRRVCSTCSLGRYQVPCFNVNEPLRVCDSCASELVTQTLFLRFNVSITESEKESDIARPSSVRPITKRPPMPDARIVSTMQSLARATQQKNKELTELQKVEEINEPLEGRKVRQTLSLSASEASAARRTIVGLAAVALANKATSDIREVKETQPSISHVSSTSSTVPPSSATPPSPKSSRSPLSIGLKKVPLLSLPAAATSEPTYSSSVSNRASPSASQGNSDEMLSPRARAVISVIASPRQTEVSAGVKRTTELERKHKETSNDLRQALHAALAVQRMVMAFGNNDNQAARKQLQDEGQKVAKLREILLMLEHTAKDLSLSLGDSALDAEVDQFLHPLNLLPKGVSPRKLDRSPAAPTLSLSGHSPTLHPAQQQQQHQQHTPPTTPRKEGLTVTPSPSQSQRLSNPTAAQAAATTANIPKTSSADRRAATDDVLTKTSSGEVKRSERIVLGTKGAIPLTEKAADTVNNNVVVTSTPQPLPHSGSGRVISPIPITKLPLSAIAATLPPPPPLSPPPTTTVTSSPPSSPVAPITALTTPLLPPLSPPRGKSDTLPPPPPPLSPTSASKQTPQPKVPSTSLRLPPPPIIESQPTSSTGSHRLPATSANLPPPISPTSRSASPSPPPPPVVDAPPPPPLTSVSPRKSSQPKAPLPAVIVPIPPTPTALTAPVTRPRGTSKPTPASNAQPPTAPTSALSEREISNEGGGGRFLLGSQRQKLQPSPTASPYTPFAPSSHELTSVLSLIEEAEQLLNQASGPRPTVSHVTAKAIQSYKTFVMGEMSIKAGDIVTIADDSDPDWVFGFANGECGFVPRTHLQFMTPHQEATKVEREADDVAASLPLTPPQRPMNEDELQVIAIAAKRADEVVLDSFHSLSDDWLSVFTEAGVSVRDVVDADYAKLLMAAAGSVVGDLDARAAANAPEGRQRHRRTLMLPTLTREKRSEVIAAVQSVVEAFRA